MARFLSHTKTNGFAKIDFGRMRTLRTLRFVPSWPVIGLIIFYLYLGAHLLSSSTGLLKLSEMKKQKAELQTRLEMVKQKREIVENKAKRLRATSLDLDMLDEQVRAILNLSYPNEMVIWLDENP